MKFINFFLCLWIIFALLYPDPDCESVSRYVSGSTALFLTVLNDLIETLVLNVIIGAAQEVQKKRAEVEQEIKKQPLNVDTLSKEGFSKVRTGNQNWRFFSTGA
jgi:hypothetical protein